MTAPDLRERLEESEKLMSTMSKTWEQKLEETERIHQVTIFSFWVFWNIKKKLVMFINAMVITISIRWDFPESR